MLFLFLLAILHSPLVAPSSTSSWRNNCMNLENPAVAPFLYLTQSDLVVLGFYSNIDYARFKDGRQLQFYVTPACFVKGFDNSTFLTIISGTQKCKITPLSSLIEYPTLLFLKKKPKTYKHGRDGTSTIEWLLLNSGEYQHIPHGHGLLFGTGPGGKDFPQTCGVRRERTQYDEKSECRDTNCKRYCSYKVANSGNCLAPSEILRRYLSPSDIPKAVPPFDNRDRTVGRSTGEGNSNKSGSSGASKYDGSGGSSSSGNAVIATRGSDKLGGTASSLSRPLSLLILHLCMLCLVALRYVA